MGIIKRLILGGGSYQQSTPQSAFDDALRQANQEFHDQRSPSYPAQKLGRYPYYHYEVEAVKESALHIAFNNYLAQEGVKPLSWREFREALEGEQKRRHFGR